MATWFLIGLALLVAASDEAPADRKEAPVEARVLDPDKTKEVT